MSPRNPAPAPWKYGDESWVEALERHVYDRLLDAGVRVYVREIRVDLGATGRLTLEWRPLFRFARGAFSLAFRAALALGLWGAEFEAVYDPEDPARVQIGEDDTESL